MISHNVQLREFVVQYGRGNLRNCTLLIQISHRLSSECTYLAPLQARRLRWLNFVANQEMPWHEVHEFLDGVKSCCEVLPLTLTIHEQALTLAERCQLSIYDALVCAAALEGEAHTLLTEDMHKGLVLGKLKLKNPFK